MIVKTALIGILVYGALQFTVADAALKTAEKVLAQAGQVEVLKQSARCAQAQVFGLSELRARGLTLNCG